MSKTVVELIDSNWPLFLLSIFFDSTHINRIEVGVELMYINQSIWAQQIHNTAWMAKVHTNNEDQRVSVILLSSHWIKKLWFREQ
jgi:hypothetical protein